MRPAQPAAQEPEQALTRPVELPGMTGAQVEVIKRQIHPVVKKLDQRFDIGFAAYPFKGGVELWFFLDLHRQLIAPCAAFQPPGC